MPDRLIVVDDVFDSGRSIYALKEKLKELMRLNLIKIFALLAVLQTVNNKTPIEPDYYIHNQNY